MKNKTIVFEQMEAGGAECEDFPCLGVGVTSAPGAAQETRPFVQQHQVSLHFQAEQG